MPSFVTLRRETIKTVDIEIEYRHLKLFPGLRGKNGRVNGRLRKQGKANGTQFEFAKSLPSMHARFDSN
eukprot:401954-Ditylum_brightwellii.AAC.1